MSVGAVQMSPFDNIEASLPNGFHDAELQKVVIDYMTMEVQVTLDIWIGQIDDPVLRESYRKAVLTLSGLIFWITDAPSFDYPYDLGGGISVDSGPIASLEEARKAHLPPIPEGTFGNYFYVNDWNSLMYFCAKDASLTWIGDRTVRQYPD
jgi:hypothetical protein